MPSRAQSCQSGAVALKKLANRIIRSLETRDKKVSRQARCSAAAQEPPPMGWLDSKARKRTTSHRATTAAHTAKSSLPLQLSWAFVRSLCAACLSPLYKTPSPLAVGCRPLTSASFTIAFSHLRLPHIFADDQSFWEVSTPMNARQVVERPTSALFVALKAIAHRSWTPPHNDTPTHHPSRYGSQCLSQIHSRPKRRVMAIRMGTCIFGMD